MDVSALEHLRRLDEEGSRRFSGWDASRFHAYGREVLAPAWERIGSVNPRVFEGLAAIVQQGVGERYLTGDPSDPPTNFLEFCLREWLPERLIGQPGPEPLPLLARVWNLGEGLLREPEWVNDYIMSRIGELRGQVRPETFLVNALKPLLEPVEPARWEGPYQIWMLSLRPDDDEFLPGPMRLVAPTVLVVEDRRRAVRLGIHLRRDGKSCVLGRFGASGSYADEPSLVGVRWKGGAARIGNEQVQLPLLSAPMEWVQVRAGFVVANAVDSQRIWIVEAAA